MKPTYEFTVITAVYNAAPFLPETVESLVEQSFDFSKVQLILIDDGSVDESPVLCDAYRAAYPDNVEVIHKENGGHGSAVNAGIDNATGLYFKVVDSDDWVETEFLEKMYSV